MIVTEPVGGSRDYLLGISSLYSKPLLLIVPSKYITDQEPPGLAYDLIYEIDLTLRCMQSKDAETAYRALDSGYGLKKGNGIADFWHYRHWDDANNLATFIVEIPKHASVHLDGKYLLASSRHQHFANPCLAPQISNEPAIMVLVDDEGNMVLPFDNPLNDEGEPVEVGTVSLPSRQFSTSSQAIEAKAILESFGYSVEPC